MKVTHTRIDGVAILDSPVNVDERGSLLELYVQSEFLASGLHADWPIDVLSESRLRGTVRGIHYQIGDADLAKLVRVVKGSVFDVVVDLRRRSATFGEHVSFTLEPDGRAVLVPHGCGHGYMTLAEDTVMLYKMSEPFVPAKYRGVRWDTPDLNIKWPADPGAKLVSKLDRSWPPSLDGVDLP